MDSGDLITILFWGAVILFSILQTVVQGKRQKEEKEKAEGAEGFDFPEVDEPRGWEAEESARDMIPEEVWEEISGLARGEREGPEELVSVEARGGRSSESGVPAEAASYDDAIDEKGSPPTRQELERKARRLEGEAGDLTGVSRPKPPRVSRPGRGGGRRSRVLGDMSGKELKRAVLLHEVLGPPVSKREKGRGGR